MTPEKVLVINKDIVESMLLDEKEDLTLWAKEIVYKIILANYDFMERSIAELSFDMKQIIPYVVISNNNRFLMLKRTEKQTEKRLHNKLSLGVGGHINPNDIETYDNIIEGGLYRELNEEVLVHDHKSLRFVGIINDNSNEVSRVHLGLLYVLEVGTDEFELPEKEKMTGEWVKKEDLYMYYEDLETWSQIAYHYLVNTSNIG